MSELHPKALDHISEILNLSLQAVLQTHFLSYWCSTQAQKSVCKPIVRTDLVKLDSYTDVYLFSHAKEYETLA